MNRILLALTFVVLHAAAASACDCTGWTHAKEFRQSEAIFLGRIVSIGKDDIYAGDPAFSRAPFRLLTFRVEKGWKGAGRGEVSALTHARLGPCSAFEFREGGEYLVYVYTVLGHRFVTSDCAHSNEAESDFAKRKMKELGSMWFRLKARLWRF